MEGLPRPKAASVFDFLSSLPYKQIIQVNTQLMSLACDLHLEGLAQKHWEVCPSCKKKPISLIATIDLWDILLSHFCFNGMSYSFAKHLWQTYSFLGILISHTPLFPEEHILFTINNEENDVFN